MSNEKKHEIRVKEAEDFGEFFRKQLEGISDPNLLIIKGHVLVEYALNNYIKKIAKNGDMFDDRKFSFAQKLNIVETICPLTVSTIELAKKFNKIRNQIAHKLDYDDILLKDFIDHAITFVHLCDIVDKENPYTIPTLRASISLMCTSLNYGVVAHAIVREHLPGADFLYKEEKYPA